MSELVTDDPTEAALRRALDAYVEEAFARGLRLTAAAIPEEAVERISAQLPMDLTELVLLPADGTLPERLALRVSDGFGRYAARAAEYYAALVARHDGASGEEAAQEHAATG